MHAREHPEDVAADPGPSGEGRFASGSASLPDLVLRTGVFDADDLRRAARRRAGWATRGLARLERIGRRAGRPRTPAETPREYAAALAAYLGDDRVRAVGDALDAEGFSRSGTSPASRRQAEAVLSSLGP